MVRLELTEQEAAELREILTRYLSDLRVEIVDTDSFAFKEALRSEKGVVFRILEQLLEQPASR